MKSICLKQVFPLIAAIICSISLTVAAQEGRPTTGAIDQTEAFNTAQKWAQAVAQADVSGLDGLLHTDYLHTHATALVETKTSFIEALRTGARKYDPIHLEEPRVRIFGDSAIVSGKFTLRATTRERVIESINRFGLLIVKTPTGLQVASFQATAIPPAK